MKSLARHFEEFILRIQAAFGVKHLHTVIILFLLLVNLVLTVLVFLVAKSPTSIISTMVLDFLKFFFVVILLGIILGITSNYLYDKVTATLNNPTGKAISESRLINYFLPDKETEKERRTNLTVERMHSMKGEVCLFGIAATSYLPKRDDTTPFSQLFISKLINKEINLRLLLLNPYSQASKFRYAREEGVDVDAIREREWKEDRFEKSAFYSDIVNTLDKVKELRNKGANIECRLTNFEPAISMMYTSDFVHVDILSLGRLDETTKFKKQRATFPITEFSSDSTYYQIAKSHFEYHWKYGITPDEFGYYKFALKESFFGFSYTGYRLIKQHDSWISIDPVIGCNAGCKYCVLQTTFRNDIKPKVYTSHEIIGDRLRESKFYHEEAVICLFNYTDALLTENKERLISCLKALKEKQFRNWVCIPTKHPFDVNFSHRIMESYHQDKLIFLISLSGMPTQYEPSINAAKIIATMKMLKELKIPLIHYWRPVTRWNSSDQDIESILAKVCEYADCSVVVGLKASEALNGYYLREGLIRKSELKDHGDYLPEGFMERVKRFLNQKGKEHPVYLHASCAVSKITSQPDYNGTMLRNEVCSLFPTGVSLCVSDQQSICQNFRTRTQHEFDETKCREIIREILPRMNMKINDHTVELLDPVYQEDLIYLVHRLRQPIVARQILYTNQYVGSILT